MTLNEIVSYAIVFYCGYIWYIVWQTIKTIWHNAREATAKQNQQDPYQDPQNWGA